MVIWWFAYLPGNDSCQLYYLWLEFPLDSIHPAFSIKILRKICTCPSAKKDVYASEFAERWLTCTWRAHFAAVDNFWAAGTNSRMPCGCWAYFELMKTNGYFISSFHWVPTPWKQLFFIHFDHPSSKCWPHTGKTVGWPCKKNEPLKNGWIRLLFFGISWLILPRLLPGSSWRMRCCFRCISQQGASVKKQGHQIPYFAPQERNMEISWTFTNITTWYHMFAWSIVEKQW